MQNISLQQAIFAIYDIELNNYFMTRAIQSLDKALHKSIPQDTNNNLSKPKKPTPPTPPVKKMGASGIFAATIIGAICGVVVKIVVGIINYLIAYNSAPEGGQDAVVDMAPSLIFNGFWVWVAIFAVIGLVIGVLASIADNNKYKANQRTYQVKQNEYNRQLKRYELDHAEYLEQRTRSEHDWQTKMTARKNALVQQKEQLLDRIRESNTLLINLYNTVGIDSKFRNIIPIAYMNEFLKLGVSTKLEGSDGLYYLTMKELRMDQMQYKLDTIITKLDTLIDQQHAIYGELLNLNTKCDRMISSTVRQTDALLAQNHLISDQNTLLAKIESNSAIAAYNAERVAREQEYQSYMIRYQSW